MKLLHRTPLTMIFLVVLFVFFSSCGKDNDLFDEYVLEPDEEVVDPGDGNGDTDGDTDQDPDTGQEPDDGSARPPSSGGNPDWFPSSPTVSKPEGGSSYTPNNAADMSSPSNAGRTAIISNSFDCTGCTFAANQLIVPNGGAISGSNMDLNGAYIDQVAEQAFSSSATFKDLYDNSWVAPEVFGGFADDENDDQDAIEALMKNVKFVRSKSGGAYIKNGTNFIDRSGDFIWDFNGGKVEVTSAARYNTSQTSRDYIFWTGNMNLKLYDGEIDGNNLYGRGIWMIGPEAYHIENMLIHNLYANQNYRAVGVLVHLYNTAPVSKSYGAVGTVNIEKDFVNGYMNYSVIENIKAEGDCEFNNVPSGVAKGFWFEYEDIDPSTQASIYHSNNVIQNIFGEDAEGLYLDDKTFGGGNRVNNHSIQATFYNETIRECNRRAAKITVSNVTFDSCTFEVSSAAISNKALASLVDFFVFNNSTYPEDHNTNIEIKNNIFRQPDKLPANDNSSGCGGYIPDVALLSIADTYNAKVVDNTFERPDLDNYAGIRLGSTANPGKIRTSTFSGNKFYNCGYDFMRYCLNEGATPNVIQNETFDYNITGTGGASHAIFRFVGSNGAVEGFDINNINIDIKWTSNILSFYGLLHSNGVELKNFNWSNINLTYSNGSGTYFGRSQGDLGNSNTFEDIVMTNADGQNSFVIDGQQTPILNNCTDDSGSPITIQ